MKSSSKEIAPATRYNEFESIKLVAFDGPPGTGKTRKIVETASTWGKIRGAVITYTNDAAAIIKQRAPDIPSGTIYSLTWPYVREYLKGTRPNTARSRQTYSTRRIHHIFDPALEQYSQDAPSNKAPNRLDELAKRLHAWSSLENGPPFNLDKENPMGQLKYLLPIARWLEDGAPMPDAERFDLLMIDESQDMSWVELRAALALVKPGGTVRAFGDPGQAIFGTAKGILGNALPPVWIRADNHMVLDKGYRVGDPVARTAAGVLRTYYNRPASSFKADHTTQLLAWDFASAPLRGLVLGYARRGVAKACRDWGLTQTGIVPKVAQADRELVLSTGHAAKGAEADDVYLLPWSRIAMQRLETNDPATIRLLYVMLTRARRRVFLPRTLKARIQR